MFYQALSLILSLGIAALTVARAPSLAVRKPVPAPAPPRVATLRPVAAIGANLKPFVVARPQGGVYLVWARRAAEDSAVFFARSTTGSRFTTPLRVTPPGMHLDLGAESGPHVAVDGKRRLYVVWAAGSKPKAEPRSSAGDGGHKHPPRPSGLTIYLASSSDDGKTFSSPRQVNDGPNGPEHRFPTVTVDKNGVVYVAWLDKRKETPEQPGYSRAFFAKSVDGGQTFSPNRDVTGSPEHPICHCCKLALATHPAEGLFIAFRNDCNDLRDMFFVRSKDGGQSFSQQAPMEQTRWIVPT
jgi:hypothetical protein